MKSNVLYIIITVLCCLLTASSTYVVKGWSMDEKYASKDELASVNSRITMLRQENREDHKEINTALQKIIQELGRIQGATAQKTP